MSRLCYTIAAVCTAWASERARTTVSMYDPRGSLATKARDQGGYIARSIHILTVHYMTFGSYIETAACGHSPQSINDFECATQKAHRCVCVCVCVCVYTHTHTHTHIHTHTHTHTYIYTYEGSNFNSGNYLFTTDTK